MSAAAHVPDPQGTGSSDISRDYGDSYRVVGSAVVGEMSIPQSRAAVRVDDVRGGEDQVT